jgi:hypothetical protein
VLRGKASGSAPAGKDPVHRVKDCTMPQVAEHRKASTD